MFRAAVLCVTLACALGDPVLRFKDCGSVNGKIVKLDVTPCSTFPCKFAKGKNASISIEVKANTEVTSAKTVVHGLIAGISAPFPIPDSNACHSMSCPLKAGSRTTYKNSIFVKEIFPKIRLVVKWEIKDQTGKDFICFIIPVEIVD